MSWKERAVRRLRRYGWLAIILTAAVAGTLASLGHIEETLSAMSRVNRAPASRAAPRFQATPTREPSR